jgi:hypothetical protein
MGGARLRAGSIAALLLATLGTGGAAVSTRGDLEALRRKVALLESELALAKTRKPYLVVDAESRRLRYRLLGMTMREIPLRGIEIGGLKRSGAGGAPGLLALAGTVVIREKDGDPRLTPLTPEDVEAGAADENVADALPPEAPAAYTIQFRQPVTLRVEGLPESQGAVAHAVSWWRRLWPGGSGGASRIDLRLTLRLEEGPAREVYRSLIPGERIVLIPPAGYVLPDIGQEAPGKIKPGKTVKTPAPLPGTPAEGVPFQIPPPVDAATQEEAPPANAGEPDDENAPAVEAEPDPDWQEVPPAEARPTPSPGTGGEAPGPPQNPPPPSGGA